MGVPDDWPVCRRFLVMYYVNLSYSILYVHNEPCLCTGVPDDWPVCRRFLDLLHCTSRGGARYSLFIE